MKSPPDDKRNLVKYATNLVDVYDWLITKALWASASKFISEADSPKLLATLEALNLPDDLKNYILSLPPEYQGPAIGKLKKMPGATVGDVQAVVEEIRQKSQQKAELANKSQQKLQDMRQYLPDFSLTEAEEEWFLIQLRKSSPQVCEFMKANAAKAFTISRTENLSLSSFTFDELLKYVETNPDVDKFIRTEQDKETPILARFIDEAPLDAWLRSNFERIRKEWGQNINVYLKKTGKNFHELLENKNAIQKAFDDGQYRGEQMPDHPLRNGEHEQLLANIESISHWWNAYLVDRADAIVPQIKLNELSVSDVLAAVDAWEKSEAEKGRGAKYDDINPARIVYGPDNWKSEKYKGYFILELVSDNDLKTEGFKMQHCVGSYCDKVADGTSKILSLRNISAPYEPIITIETDPSYIFIRQEYGVENSQPDALFHAMIEEWNDNKVVDISKLDPDKFDSNDFSKLMERDLGASDGLEDFLLRTIKPFDQNDKYPAAAKKAERIRSIADADFVLPTNVQIAMVNAINSNPHAKGNHTIGLEHLAKRVDLCQEAINLIIGAPFSDASVLSNLVKNRNTTDDQIKIILEKNPRFHMLKEEALYNRKISEGLFSSLYNGLLEQKADRPRELASLQLNTARLPQCPPDILRGMYNKMEGGLKPVSLLAAFASNAKLPPDLLEIVLTAARQHTRETGQIWERLASNRGLEPDLYEEIRKSISKNDDDSAANNTADNLLHNPKTPTTVLDAIWKNSRISPRSEFAEWFLDHPNTPQYIKDIVEAARAEREDY